MKQTKNTVQLFNANITIKNGRVNISEALQAFNGDQGANEVRRVNSRKLARLINNAQIVIK